MTRFVERHPAWALIVIIAIALALWLTLAVWPPGLEEAIGRKRVFLNAVFNGITLGGLYFLVASGFTLIFGLMRNVNLAHGSLYLFGGYVGYAISASTGSWLLSFIVAFILTALVGVLLQLIVFRRMEGQDLRQTMVTIGLSIVFADLMLWACGGDFYQIQTPNWLIGPIELPLVTAVKSSGEPVYLRYPLVRLVIFAASVVIGLAMWLALNRTRIGMIIRAGVDDRDILAATGVRIQLVFVLVFCARCRACRHRRRRRRHLPVSLAWRRHPLPACLARRRHRRRHGLDPRCRARRADHRPRRTARFGLHPDLRHRRDLPDHGAGTGSPAARPVGEALRCRSPTTPTSPFVPPQRRSAPPCADGRRSTILQPGSSRPFS
ncbi:ABC-type branched-subunit amino acid transport system permease subunit [Bradyrhizobium sp. i1.3.6]